MYAWLARDGAPSLVSSNLRKRLKSHCGRGVMNSWRLVSKGRELREPLAKLCIQGGLAVQLITVSLYSRRLEYTAVQLFELSSLSPCPLSATDCENIHPIIAGLAGLKYSWAEFRIWHA
jgi:hypothetical protein